MCRQLKAGHPIHLNSALAGPFYMLSASLTFTLLTLTIKLLNPAFTVWQIGFYRYFGGMVVLLSLFGRHGNPYKSPNVRLLILRGCVGSAGFISLIMAIRLLPIATAMVIFYSFPAFSAVFSFLIYKERVGAMALLSITATIVGIAIIFDFQLAGEMMGQAIALLGGVLAGLTITLIRSLRERNGPVIIYLYLCTMGSLLTFPKFISHPMLPATAADWFMISAIILLSLSGQLLMNQGFLYCKGWEGGVIMSTEVVFTAIVGIVILGDPVSPRFLIGGLLVLGSVVMLNRLKSRP